MPSPHYTLVYWDAPEPERVRRAAQLEENFKAFYLLYAIRGVVLPIPDRPLVAFLAKSGQETIRLAHSLDGLPRVADAFYSPDNDVLVLSPERLDAAGQTFQRQVQQIYREGVNRKDMLAGVGPVLDTSGTVKGRKQPEEVARWMTWVMVDCYLEEESERAGVSREASRQLLHATGILPRHVALPLWLSEGSADYFCRPKGPVHSTRGDDRKPVVTLAESTGYGVPNYVRQKQFRDLTEQKQINADPGIFLRHVVADTYYAAIRKGVDADDPKLPQSPAKPLATADTYAGGPAAAGPGAGPRPNGPQPGGPMGSGAYGGPGTGGRPGMGTAHSDDVSNQRRKRLHFLVGKAYSTSWALYFYLVRNDPDGLARYLSELDRLPRDLPLDEQARVDIFARAFHLNSAADFTAYGNKWLEAIRNVPAAGIDIQLAEIDHEKDGKDHKQSGSGLPPGPRTQER